MSARRSLRLAAALAFTSLPLSAASPSGTGGPLYGAFDAADFQPGTAIDNPYWPLLPDTQAVYTSRSREGCSVNVVSVTGQMRSGFPAPYDGIQAWVVLDRVWLDPQCSGHYALTESTRDWYAQDQHGNVWYFGEATREWGDPTDCPSTEGSWTAGGDGAQPGIVMLADPRPALAYRQEFQAGVAEDWGRVLRLNARATTPAGNYSQCLVTKEWSPLEHGSVEQKVYCPSAGLVQVFEMGHGPRVTWSYVGSTRPPGNYAANGVCPAP